MVVPNMSENMTDPKEKPVGVVEIPCVDCGILLIVPDTPIGRTATVLCGTCSFKRRFNMPPKIYLEGKY